MDDYAAERKGGRIDWKETILANWQLLNRLAVRRFGYGSLAEEAALAVMDQLLADDARRLQGYEGRASAAAYLASVSWRLLEDFSRKRYGRRRAPLWIRTLGGVWLTLYTLLCLERLDIMEAVAIIRQRQAGDGDTDPEAAAWTIRQQVLDCGAHQGLEVAYEEELAVADDTPGLVGEQVERLERRERKELLAMLFRILTDAPEETVEQNSGRLSLLAIRLSPEERLLLSLVFRDELPVARAGAMVGLNRHQVHGRLRRLLERLRSELRQAGLDREILELLR